MPPPTGSIPNAITRFLHARQSTVPVRRDGSSSGTNLSGGAIAGIVIGSIVGFLLLLWIFRSCTNLGGPPQESRDPAWYDDVSAKRSRSRHSRRQSRGSYYVQETHPRRSSREVTRVVQPVYVEPRRPSRTYFTPNIPDAQPYLRSFTVLPRRLVTDANKGATRSFMLCQTEHNMRFFLAIAVFAASVFARTAVIVPLYVYPGNMTWTNPDWSAVVNAIKHHPHMHFFVIINPNNGPRNRSDPTGFNGGFCQVYNNTDYIPHGCNRDWTTHMSAISKLSNAQTIGYVYTNYGQRPAEEVKADILEWSQWDKQPTWEEGKTADISIHGIWFDEVGTTSGNSSDYLELVKYANDTFHAKGSKRGRYSVILNSGPVQDPTYEAELFKMSSAVVTKETCYTSDPASLGVSWDCPEPYSPFEFAALTAGSGLPHNPAFLPQTVVLVHQFRGPPTATIQTLREQIEGVVSLGVHSTYFTSGSWHNTTLMPANIGNWIPAAAYIVLNSAEVAPALAIIRNVRCKFAIRTNGHNTNMGFSRIDGTGGVLGLSGLAKKNFKEM
ncbi:Spherulin-4 [Cytospora mali]|uniref:Spherulin-4 n=1 Tax=Cytospora mali TaxID=578113 RepID=A0A194UU98_CYTMA|nr:Spherulin-4 [Valsa mali var. pyri (nom. inval.)]